MQKDDLSVKIPFAIKQALKIPEKEMGTRLQLELAIHLYEEWFLSFGKAVELSGVSRWVFAEELVKREISRHYTEKELQEDISFGESAGDDNGCQ